MKNTNRTRTPGDEPRKEYRFDYAESQPNRFARRAAEPCVAVVLDPDVARAVGSSRRANQLLRAALRKAPPARTTRRRVARDE